MDSWDLFWILMIYFPVAVLWIYAIVDLILWRKDLGWSAKVLWVIAVTVLPLGGGVIYVLFRPSVIPED